jgi:hypothetical protein
MSKKYYGIDSIGKLFVQQVDTLPDWAAADERRVVYAKDTGKLWRGSGEGWVLVGDVDQTQLSALAARVTVNENDIDDLKSKTSELELSLGVEKWSIIDSSYALSESENLFVKYNGYFEVFLPANPEMGAKVNLIFVGTPAAGEGITIKRNGSLIMGAAEDMAMDTPNASFALVYSNAEKGWRMQGSVLDSEGASTIDLSPYQTLTPVLSAPANALEELDVTVTITNYDADAYYEVSVTAGSFTRAGGVITWTMPQISAGAEQVISVRAAAEGYLISRTAHATIALGALNLAGDSAIILENATMNDMNVPTKANTEISNAKLVCKGNNATATTRSFFQELGDNAWGRLQTTLKASGAEYAIDPGSSTSELILSGIRALTTADQFIIKNTGETDLTELTQLPSSVVETEGDSMMKLLQETLLEVGVSGLYTKVVSLTDTKWVLFYDDRCANNDDMHARVIEYVNGGLIFGASIQIGLTNYSMPWRFDAARLSDNKVIATDSIDQKVKIFNISGQTITTDSAKHLAMPVYGSFGTYYYAASIAVLSETRAVVATARSMEYGQTGEYQNVWSVDIAPDDTMTANALRTCNTERGQKAKICAINESYFLAYFYWYLEDLNPHHSLYMGRVNPDGTCNVGAVRSFNSIATLTDQYMDLAVLSDTRAVIIYDAPSSPHYITTAQSLALDSATLTTTILDTLAIEDGSTANSEKCVLLRLSETRCLSCTVLATSVTALKYIDMDSGTGDLSVTDTGQDLSMSDYAGMVGLAPAGDNVFAFSYNHTDEKLYGFIFRPLPKCQLTYAPTLSAVPERIWLPDLPDLFTSYGIEGEYLGEELELLLDSAQTTEGLVVAKTEKSGLWDNEGYHKQIEITVGGTPSIVDVTNVVASELNNIPVGTPAIIQAQRSYSLTCVRLTPTRAVALYYDNQASEYSEAAILGIGGDTVSVITTAGLPLRRDPTNSYDLPLRAVAPMGAAYSPTVAIFAYKDDAYDLTQLIAVDITGETITFSNKLEPALNLGNMDNVSMVLLDQGKILVTFRSNVNAGAILKIYSCFCFYDETTHQLNLLSTPNAIYSANATYKGIVKLSESRVILFLNKYSQYYGHAMLIDTSGSTPSVKYDLTLNTIANGAAYHSSVMEDGRILVQYNSDGVGYLQILTVVGDTLTATPPVIFSAPGDTVMSFGILPVGSKFLVTYTSTLNGNNLMGAFATVSEDTITLEAEQAIIATSVQDSADSQTNAFAAPIAGQTLFVYVDESNASATTAQIIDLATTYELTIPIQISPPTAVKKPSTFSDTPDVVGSKTCESTGDMSLLFNPKVLATYNIRQIKMKMELATLNEEISSVKTDLWMEA